MNKIEAAITEYFGERCPETVPGCPCCDAWIEYDALVASREKTLREAAALFETPNGRSYIGEVTRNAILALIEAKP